ncbi:SDR family NAD(P)-dependent oxidoreductase [Streptomyces gramineus]|uniref:SDR family NAD(P)-dependent oxidoreductase n=1 Tax=Streptomyces gramineus TaxID=910542 RepID=UPI00398AD651
MVTGGSRGLGLLVADELMRRGCRVTLAARDPAELDRAGAQLRHPAGTVRTDVTDVRDQRAVAELFRRTVAACGSVDVADAGAGDRLALIGWVGGLPAVPHLLPYSCAKAAVGALGEGLQEEAARDGVSVTVVHQADGLAPVLTTRLGRAATALLPTAAGEPEPSPGFDVEPAVPCTLGERLRSAGSALNDRAARASAERRRIAAERHHVWEHSRLPGSATGLPRGTRAVRARRTPVSCMRRARLDNWITSQSRTAGRSRPGWSERHAAST